MFCRNKLNCPANRLFFGDNLKWLRDAKVFPNAHPDSMSGSRFSAGGNP